jgi:hypothetical protein
MRLIKLMTLGAMVLSASAVAASAQDDPRQSPTVRPQIAANPGLPASPLRLPGPKVGPTTYIPTYIPASPSAAQPAPTAVAPGQDNGSYYSSKGFGPKPQ